MESSLEAGYYGLVLHQLWIGNALLRIIIDDKQVILSLKATLSISTEFLLKGDSLNYFSRLRIVSDACFRYCDITNILNLNS